MRNLKLIATIAVAIYIFTAASAQEPPATAAIAKVRALHQERIASLKSVVEIETRLNEIGKAPPEAVLDAKVAVHEAEAAAAETQTDRIAALQQLVTALKDCEEAAKARKLAARDTESAVLKAKANRLAAEIRLLEAQSSGSTAGPQK